MLEKDVLTGMEPYRERVVEPLISDLLSELPALLLVGPRATGKTTTAARYAATTVRLDRPAEAAAFRGDPDAALRGLDEPVLLDEWQAVPGATFPHRALDIPRQARAKWTPTGTAKSAKERSKTLHGQHTQRLGEGPSFVAAMIATTDLAERLAQADAALWVDWMHAVRDLPGDPHGADVETFDTVTALHVHGAPVPYYNRVLGLTDGHASMIDEALGYYNERFTPCRVDVNPFYSGPSLLMALNDRGFHPSEFQTNLYMEPVEVEPVQVPGVQVREIRPEETEFFSRLYDRAYHGDRTPKRLARFRMDSIRARIGRPGWRFYIAMVDGVPAGGAALFVQDGVGHLAGGATMFTLRGRGGQKALLNRRLLDAHAAGCEIVVSRCGVGSTSQRNMERAGLRTAYTKSIWQARSPV